MDLLKKEYINFVVDRYYKTNHELHYSNVMKELKDIYESFCFIDDELHDARLRIKPEQNQEIININIGSYILMRIDGMPQLIYDL